VQGGGNMPAYGKNLSPPEVTALVQFLDTLHPPGQIPATDAAAAAAEATPPAQEEPVGSTQSVGGTSAQSPPNPAGK
jgi:ubiquinol-cytochrome c reductase cytochrome b subunit